MGLNQINDNVNLFKTTFDNYLKEINHSKFYTIFERVLKINSFEKLFEIYLLDTDKNLKERNISMLYLDKMATTHGKLHPDFKFVDDTFGGINMLFASLEIINMLNHIKFDERLPTEALELIDQWITGEMNAIPLIIIMEYFLDFSIIDFKLSSNILNDNEKHNELKMFVEAGNQKKLNPDDVKVIAKQIVKQIKNLKPGERLKIPAGSLTHTTRIIIEKNEDNTTKLLHSNTGDGALIVESIESTLIECQLQSPEELEDSQFWEDFLNSKIKLNTDGVNALLNSLTGEFKIAKDQKSPQEMGSCTVKSIENDLKHFIISHASNREIGFQIYKLIKSLMISKSKEYIHQSIHPYLKDMLIEKEIIRKRYFNWISICDDKQQFQEVKEAYLAAIRDLHSERMNSGLVDSMIANIKSDTKDLTNLHILKYLDKYVDKLARGLSIDVLENVRSKYSTQMTFEGVNYLCLRPTLWLKNNKNLLDEILSDNSIKNQVYKILIQASKTFLPGYVTKEVQNELYVREMEKKDLLDLLLEYSPRQDPLIVVEQLRQGISNQKFLFSELTHLENSLIESFVANIDIEFLQNNFLSDPLDMPSIIFLNKQIDNLRRQQEEGRSCLLFADQQLEKVLELLTKAEVPEVKKMFQNLLSGIAVERVKGLLHSGNVMKALETAYDSQYALKLIVDSHENAGGGLETLNAWIDSCKEEPFKSEFIADIGLIYLKRGQDTLALELAAGIKEREQASKLLSAIAEYYIANEEMDLAKMLISKEILTEQDHSKFSSDIGLIYLKRGQDKLALELAAGIKEREQASKLLSAIAEYYISNEEIDRAKMLISKELLTEQDYTELNKKMGVHFGSQKNWKEMETTLSNLNSIEADKIFLQFVSAYIQDQGFISGIEWTEKINNSKIKRSAVQTFIDSGANFDFSHAEIDEIIAQFKAMQSTDDSHQLIVLFAEMFFSKQKRATGIHVITQAESEHTYSVIARELQSYAIGKFNDVDDAVDIFEVLKEVPKEGINYYALYCINNLISHNPSEAKKLVELVRTLNFEKPSEVQKKYEYFYFRIENSLLMFDFISNKKVNEADRAYFAQYFLESILRIDTAEAKKFAEMVKTNLNIQFDEKTLQLLEKSDTQ